MCLFTKKRKAAGKNGEKSDSKVVADFKKMAERDDADFLADSTRRVEDARPSSPKIKLNEVQISDAHKKVNNDLENVQIANDRVIIKEDRPLKGEIRPVYERRQSWSNPANGVCQMLEEEKSESVVSENNQTPLVQLKKVEVVAVEEVVEHKSQEKVAEIVHTVKKEKVCNEAGDLPMLQRRQSWSNPVNGALDFLIEN